MEEDSVVIEMKELRKEQRRGSGENQAFYFGDSNNVEDGGEEDGSSASFVSKVAPAELTWNDLGTSVQTGGNKFSFLKSRKKKKEGHVSQTKKKVLLKNVSGTVKPGELMAVMGPSGAGKTTMLNLLAHRTPSSQLQEGEIRVNGKRVTTNYFKNFSGFVTQEDIMQPFLTVHETIKFYARLRLPANLSEEEIDSKVEEVITVLGLRKCRNTRIGNSIVRGISGGEKKRVNIAIEILSNPSILFLDEPTSGLDAFTSLNLVKLLKKMAKETGMSIVCTIHQPRLAIFNLFDILLLLGQGETVYFGPTKSAPEYFRNAGFPIPQYSNPADFFLDIITPDNTTPTRAKKRLEQIAQLIEHYNKTTSPISPTSSSSVLGEEMSRSSTTLSRRKSRTELRLTRRETQELMVSMQVPKKAGWVVQFSYILYRQLLNQSRDFQFLFVRFFSSIMIALLIGFTWFQIGLSQEEIASRNGYLYLAILFSSFQEAASTVNSYPLEKEVFLHDRASGVYRVSSYLAAKFVSDLPLHVAVPGVFAITSYWLVGLNADAGDFFVFFFNTIVIGLVTSTMAFCFSATTGNANSANEAATVMQVLWIVFGGFFILKENIPDYFIWLFYMSPVKYAMSTSVLCQYRSIDKLKCHGTEDGNCRFKSGQDVIDYIAADETEIWQNFLILVGYIGLFLAGTYLALRFLNRKR